MLLMRPAVLLWIAYSPPATVAWGVPNATPAGRVIRVTLDRPAPKPAKLKPGSEMTGRLERPLYAGDRVLIPAGSHMKLVVDRTEKKKAEPKKPRGFLDRVERI